MHFFQLSIDATNYAINSCSIATIKRTVHTNKLICALIIISMVCVCVHVHVYNTRTAVMPCSHVAMPDASQSQDA